MRVALCMSGLPRFSEATTRLFKELEVQFKDDRVDWFFYLWSPKGPDPYIHESWMNLDYKTTEFRLQQRVPQSHRIVDLKIGTYQGEQDDPSLMKWPSAAPSFVAQYRVDQMRQKFEKDNDFFYDLVLRVRPDLSIRGIMPKQIPSNKLLVVHIEYWDSHGNPSCVSDVFAAGGSYEMHKYSNMINCVQNYRSLFLNPPFATECILACHLFMQGIDPYVDSNFSVDLRQANRVNENGPYYEVDYTGWEN